MQHPTRTISRKSLAEQEIEIVDRDFLCRQQSRKAQEEVSVRESWEEDGFLYTKEGNTIWVRTRRQIVIVADLFTGRLYRQLAARPALLFPPSEMDHHLDRIHVLHRHELEHGRVRYRRRQSAAGFGRDGTEDQRRVRALCLGVCNLPVGVERGQRGSGEEAVVRGDGVALLVVLLSDHQVSTLFPRRMLG